MVEHMQAWQCIGCGRIDGPQNCVGICQDRKVSFVYAEEYDQLEKRHAALQAEMDRLLVLVRQFVAVQPRNDEWEKSYKGLQKRSAELLGELKR
ncbi:MAG: hypothetical protein QM803_01590 [Rhodocyclaceae bacterium]